MDFRLAAAEIRDVCLRRCDTIFYVSLALAVLATAALDAHGGETNGVAYRALFEAVKYREFVRLLLWARHNPRYAMASLYGAYLGAAASILFRYPDYLFFEACIYLVLRMAASMLFGLKERDVVKLYFTVLFDYYDRLPPPSRPGGGLGKRARRLAPADVWSFLANRRG